MAKAPGSGDAGGGGETFRAAGERRDSGNVIGLNGVPQTD